MAIFKEVWSFVSTPGGTWNEVYYVSSPSIVDATKFTPAFKAKRLALADQLTTWRKVRISDVTGTVKPVLVTINGKGTAAGELPEDATFGPANVDEAVVLNLASITRPAKRKLWMRGVPEMVARRSPTTGETILREDFRMGINEFVDALNTTGYVILVSKPIGVDGIVRSDVTNINGTAATGQSVVTFAPAAAYQVGQRVIFKKASPKALPGLNGPYTVRAVTPNSITIDYRTPFDLEIDDAQMGFFHRLDYFDDAVIAKSPLSGFDYLGSRRSKNERTGSRGARRAVRLRHLR